MIDISPIFFQIAVRLGLLLLISLVAIILFARKKEIWQRYFTWIIIWFVLILVVLLGSYVFAIFAFALMILGITEYAKLSKMPPHMKYLSFFLSILTTVVAYFMDQRYMILPLLYFMFVTLFAIASNSKKAFENAAYTLFGLLWLVFSLGHLILLYALQNGDVLLLSILAAVSLSDIGAYIFGKISGRITNSRYIAKNISPKKTFLGIVGNVIGALAGLSLMRFAFDVSNNTMLLLGVVIGVSSVLGDLTESMVKRRFNAKDSGSLLPGHGGFLDRIDSLLRACVISYYFLILVT